MCSLSVPPRSPAFPSWCPRLDSILTEVLFAYIEACVRLEAAHVNPLFRPSKVHLEASPPLVPSTDAPIGLYPSIEGLANELACPWSIVSNARVHTR